MNSRQISSSEQTVHIDTLHNASVHAQIVLSMSRVKKIVLECLASRCDPTRHMTTATITAITSVITVIGGVVRESDGSNTE